MTTPGENATVVRRATEAFNDRDRETFDPCYAEEVVVHGRDGDRRMDHDEHWEEVLGMFEAVPDLQAAVEATVAEGDRVFVRWTYVGTPERDPRRRTERRAGRVGEVVGVPPRGRTTRRGVAALR